MALKSANADTNSIVADGPQRLAKALQAPGPRLRALESFDRRVRLWCRPRFPFGHLRIHSVRRRWFRRIVRGEPPKVSGRAVFASN